MGKSANTPLPPPLPARKLSQIARNVLDLIDNLQFVDKIQVRAFFPRVALPGAC